MSLFSRKPKRIFLDYASSTPIDKDVSSKMDEYNSKGFANPSALYMEAISAKEVLNSSREKIASILNCRKNEIIFTSGGTEGNNLALLGLFEKYKKKDFIPHIITSNIEHPAILEVCKEIEKRGGKVTRVSVSEEGLVNPKDILNAITEETILVTIMYANNEIGTIQRVREIGKIIKEWRENHSGKNSKLPYFHTDACQAGLYLNLDVSNLGVDLLTLDGLKIHGPRGAGILYVKNTVEIDPVHFGGGQEGGLRSGTENVSASLGMSLALEIADKLRQKESERLTLIRDYGIQSILEAFPKALLNGSKNSRLPNNINICFPELDAEFAVISLDLLGFASSYSSSCLTLKEDSSSYVIAALKERGKDNCRNSSLRFTLGRETTKSDINYLIRALKKVVK